MRNLKRALSLVMASAMLIGMMVVGASAANFSDSEKIANTDAVTMVSELGIINGMPDGSYQPEANIDRASMAKMICVALNGGKDPQLSAGAVNSYTDTVGNWAAGYIEYCTSLGIVAGKGDKLFAPSANVTVSEAAKMLLVALGYNAETEGLVGANWQTKTDVLANQVGLYDGFIALTSANLTRDNAAQMVYNALNASVVKYDGNKAVPQTTISYEWITNPNDPSSSTAVTKEIEKTLLADKFKVTETTGVVVANEYASVDGGKALEAGETKIGNTVYNLSTGLDLLGQKVTIYVRDTKTDGKTNVTGGAVPTDDCKVYTKTTAETKWAAKDGILYDNKLTLATGDNATVELRDYAPVTGENLVSKKNTVRGEELRVIDNNNDGVVDYIFATSYKLGKVTTYSTKDDGTLTLNRASALKFDAEDVVGFEDVAKDDYVLYLVIGEKLYVEKAESVTGKLTRVKLNSSKATDLTVDGTVYKVSGVTFYADNNNLTAAADQTTTGSSATYYQDKYGNIVAVGEVEEAAANYAVVLGYAAVASGNDLDSDRVKVLFADGTTGTYNVDKVQKYTNGKWTTDSSAKAAKGDLIAYTLDGNDITVRIADSNKLGKDDSFVTTAQAATYKFEKGKTGVTLGSEGYYATSSTLFFYANDELADFDDADIYTGYRNAPTPGEDTLVYRAVANPDKELKVVLVFNPGTASSGDYLYLYNKNSQNDDNAWFDAIIDGELVKDIEVKDNTTETGLYEYTINSDGVYEMKEASKASYIVDATVERVSGNTIFVTVGATTTEYVLSDATVSALIDGSDTALDEAVEEGDTVTLVVDEDDVEAIFITEKAPEEAEDETKTVTLGTIADVTDGGVTFKGTASVAEPEVGKTFTVTVKAEGTIAAQTTVQVTYNGTTKEVVFETSDTEKTTEAFTAAEGKTEITMAKKG